jgi:hypothetical protein
MPSHRLRHFYSPRFTTTLAAPFAAAGAHSPLVMGQQTAAPQNAPTASRPASAASAPHAEVPKPPMRGARGYFSRIALAAQ